MSGQESLDSLLIDRIEIAIHGEGIGDDSAPVCSATFKP